MESGVCSQFAFVDVVSACPSVAVVCSYSLRSRSSTPFVETVFLARVFGAEARARCAHFSTHGTGFEHVRGIKGKPDVRSFC